MSGTPMQDSPYAPPRASIEDRHYGPAPERPPLVNRAVMLLWMGLGLSLLASLWNMGHRPTTGFRPPLGFSIAGMLISLLIAWWIYSCIARGRNWARWLYIVFTVLSILATGLYAVMMPLLFRDTVRVAFAGISLVLHLYVCYLLLTGEAAEWYREMKAR